ncbi:MAG: hypothetical protein RIA08_07085 [Roseovarius sp.]|uniref:hypothetical protein n=1 Tax=Roseovarius sp. TaxID=1486281 RepID=UPI0032ECE450
MTGRARDGLLADIRRWEALLGIIREFETGRADDPVAECALGSEKTEGDQEDTEALSDHLESLRQAYYDCLGPFSGSHSHQVEYANRLKDFYFGKTGRSLLSDFPPHIRLLKAMLRRGCIRHETECYLAGAGAEQLADNPETAALAKNIRVLINDFNASAVDDKD